MPTSYIKRPPLKRFGVSILSVALACILTAAIQPFFGGKAPLVFFILASLLSAAYGGALAGLTATGLGLILVLAFFQPQVMVLTMAHSSIVVFVVLGVGISLVLGRLHQSNAALSRTTEGLEAANRKLSEGAKDLSEANQELQRFAYALAHDLTTPLRGISTLTELLVQRNAGKLDESSQECASMIVSRVHRTIAMINGLLVYAAAVEKPKDPVPVDCNAVFAQAVSDLDPAIKESGAQITADPLPSVPGASSHLVQVFSNLIGNAIKYRPIVRQPQIRISAVDHGDEWVFCVSDNGIGIEMKHADEIFGMFRRLHGEEQYPGTGIGLALCKIIVQRHGGRIWVESEVGNGSRFFFSLPKLAARAVTPETETGAGPISHLR